MAAYEPADRYSATTKAVARQQGSLAVLDIGSTKVCCLIAVVGGGDRVTVTGVGHHAAAGIRSGTIVDLEAAAGAIAEAVQSAERRANHTVERLLVSLNGPTLAYETLPLSLPLSGTAVTPAALARMLARGPQVAARPGYATVHTIASGFRLDGVSGITDPRGMVGEELLCDLQVVTASAGGVRNLETCLSRLHLQVENIAAAGLASSWAVLDRDERDLGVTVIDMGGGTTNVVVWRDGHPVFGRCLPIGGAHVTSDIARGLSTPLAAAERLKVLQGNALATAHDDSDMVEVPQIGDDAEGVQVIPRSLLNGIIRPRIEETFDMVRAALADGGVLRGSGRRVVLTGGAAQLPGVLELAQAILDKQASLGRPGRLTPLPRDLDTPAFASAAGLLMAALGREGAGFAASPVAAEVVAAANRPGVLGRLGRWVSANF